METGGIAAIRGIVFGEILRPFASCGASARCWPDSAACRSGVGTDRV